MRRWISPKRWPAPHGGVEAWAGLGSELMSCDCQFCRCGVPWRTPTDANWPSSWPLPSSRWRPRFGRGSRSRRFRPAPLTIWGARGIPVQPREPGGRWPRRPRALDVHRLAWRSASAGPSHAGSISAPNDEFEASRDRCSRSPAAPSSSPAGDRALPCGGRHLGVDPSTARGRTRRPRM